jgi:hypothetical protein
MTSVTDYNVLLGEIQTTKLTYHTYPLPDAIQSRLVLKGIPPNVPVDELQVELTAQELRVVKIPQVTKTDTTTQTLLTKYPVFLVTFQARTDVREVLLIKKLRHCII